MSALDVAMGLWFTTPNVQAAEMAAALGYRRAVLDIEHGTFDLNDLNRFIPFLKTLGLKVFAKVLAPERAPIQQALDFGADAAVIPHVQGLAHAKEVTSYVKYPPVGDRSLAGGRVFGYGGQSDDHMDRCNREILSLPMVETAGALRDIEAIAALPTVDGIFVGPGDLSARRGRGRYRRLPEDEADFRAIVAAVKQAGKIWMMPAWSEQERRFAREHGATYMVSTTELGALRAGLEAAKAQIAREIG